MNGYPVKPGPNNRPNNSLPHRLDDGGELQMKSEHFASSLMGQHTSSDYRLLRQPDVQAFLEKVAEARSILFVTGCARSGTSLMQRCLATVHDPVYYWSENSLVEIYKQGRINGAHIILKRRSACHRHFDAIPKSIKIVHMVRHPQQVFTSRVTQRKGYYVTRERWGSEYCAFETLSGRHPLHLLAVVKYEDLIRDPDRIQSHLARMLDLTFDISFSQYTQRDYLDLKIERDTGIKRRWQAIEPGRAARSRKGGHHLTHWENVRASLEPFLRRFCEQFGYTLD